MAESNEELLAQGECPLPNCVEPMGHAGPCSPCKCFFNDQLLPVRAGCEAVYCKDVNSLTAIRNEALSRIADLQRQLREAQEERDRWKASRIFYQDIVYAVCNELDKAFGRRPGLGVLVTEAAQVTARLRAERDAAIGRAEAATKRRATLWRLYRNTLDRVRRLKARAEAAKQELSAWHQEFTTTVNGKPYVMDALEAGKMVQDAEAEARMAVQDAAEQRALAIEARNVIGQVAAAYHRLVCGGSPAYWECIYPICQEARRTYLKLTPAEAHRSPQGGQEGD